MKIREEEKANVKITGFFERAKPSAQDPLDVKTIRAETILVDLVVELNLPFAALDKLSKGVKLMFPDSEIAKNFQFGRSKGTAIAKVMAAKVTLTLGERIS